MRRGRPGRPQALFIRTDAPSLPGDPFEAAEAHEYRAWYKLRQIRQWLLRNERLQAASARELEETLRRQKRKEANDGTA